MVDDEAIALMTERGTYLVADLYDGDFIAEEGLRRGWPEETMRKNADMTVAQRTGFTKALAAGVRMAFGTDAGVYPHGWNAKQLPYMVRYGMTPMEAIRSATVDAASLLGWGDRVGALEPGRFADVIAVEGDALSDLASFENVAFVIKAGVVVKG
jgi:imidazolonepropionase-like amidohydrolase